MMLDGFWGVPIDGVQQPIELVAATRVERGDPRHPSAQVGLQVHGSVEVRGDDAIDGEAAKGRFETVVFRAWSVGCGVDDDSGDDLTLRRRTKNRFLRMEPEALCGRDLGDKFNKSGSAAIRERPPGERQVVGVARVAQPGLVAEAAKASVEPECREVGQCRGGWRALGKMRCGELLAQPEMRLDKSRMGR